MYFFTGHRPGVAGGGWDDMDEEPMLLGQPSTKSADNSSSNVPVEVIPRSSSHTSSKSNKSMGDSDISLRSVTF